MTISEQLLAMSPEEILCRWVNYQLNKVGCKRVVKNFTHVSTLSSIINYSGDLT